MTGVANFRANKLCLCTYGSATQRLTRLVTWQLTRLSLFAPRQEVALFPRCMHRRSSSHNPERLLLKPCALVYI